MQRLGNGSDGWTPTHCAEDLLGQVGELLAEGWSAVAVTESLECEGFSSETAQTLVREVAQLRGLNKVSAVAEEGTCGIDLVELRRALRQPGRQLLVDPGRVVELEIALKEGGVTAATAADLVAEVASSHRRLAAVHERRLRRLGLQGMIAGSLFTAFFTWVALLSGGQGLWHLATAAMTLTLTAYSAALFLRHRPAP